MLYLVLIGVLILIFLYLRGKIRKHTRGLGLGGGLAGGRISDESQEIRILKYIRSASAENRAQESKHRAKARKARPNSRKQRKHLSRAREYWLAVFNDEHVAEQVARGKGKFKGHGIRRAGTERGRLVK